MRPSLVVSLDTKKEKQNGDSSYSLAALLKHQHLWFSTHKKSTVQVQCVQILRVRDHNAIIGRWSLSWNLLSKQARSRSEANKDLPVFSCRRRAKRRSVDSSFNSHRGFSPLLDCSWLWQHFKIARRRRRRARSRSHDSLLWSKFVRHCLVGFYVI